MPTLQLAKMELEETGSPDTTTRLPVPGYDVRTKRVESGAFFLLGLVGITLIVLAGGNAVEFCENRDSIAAALVSPAVTTSTIAQTAKAKHTLTNLTVVPASAERGPIGLGKSPSHPS